ncbi:MAG: insulinase family protein [Bacteroidales bacterium]|nr:insulinase family protein [Bacteroidales bacterium]
MAAVFAAALFLSGSCAKYKYETVKGDPLKTKIYTLDNGLKVYMTVNKETPRLQTYIAVRVGSKDDPHETTGLSHYLEHLMFKGTERFGTSDYEAEKPMLDEIRDLFEVYRTKTDPAERIALYHQIDSVSYEASKIAIPNEYDKLMSIIGSTGSNAFTSTDMTVYQEDIPSNQVENWAKIQADRFIHPVIRGFHTELEAVYEEKNMSLTEDDSKAMEAIDSVLFARHPYGIQTTIGTQEHLKNPSIINIENHRSNFYVPNNVAICVSGDFDPDTFVATIEKYFGEWEPNPGIKTLEYEPELPISAPVEKTVYGLDAEFVMLGWRTPGSKDILRSEVGEIAGSVLFNGKAGLADLDLVQAQKVGGFYLMNYDRPDYGEFLMIGYPREGQSLEEVRDLMLEEVGRLRTGDFDEDLIKSTINNIKLSQMTQLENNSRRAMSFVNSFISGHKWKDDALQARRLEKVTKRQVADWANEYLGPNSYALAFKRTGEDPNIDKIAAPAITPIETNRHMQSDFLTSIQLSEVAPIEPVFPDFAKDMAVDDLTGGIEFLYKKNEINDITSYTAIFDRGSQTDPRLDLAFSYLEYLGTPTRDAAQIKKDMYSLACSYSLSAGPVQTVVRVRGLDENIGQAMDIVEDLVYNAVPDTAVLSALKADALKNRADSKLNQGACFSALQNYIFYGPDFVAKSTLSDETILSLTSEELLGAVRDLFSKKHEVLYYGPAEEVAARKMIISHHKMADNPAPLVKERPLHQKVSGNQVFLVPYDANQFYYVQYSDRGEKFDLRNDPSVTMYNNYFGSGMNAIVFQEMREARGLAYSARASLNAPSYPEDDYMFYAFIASQNDKLKDAVVEFDRIINQMPESEQAFQVAKAAVLSQLRTRRVTGMGVLNQYLSLRDLGLAESRDKAVFEAVQGMTLADVKSFQEKWIKGRQYTYGFLGREGDFDTAFISTLGPVTHLTLEDIFGY